MSLARVFRITLASSFLFACGGETSTPSPTSPQDAGFDALAVDTGPAVDANPDVSGPDSDAGGEVDATGFVGCEGVSNTYLTHVERGATRLAQRMYELIPAAHQHVEFTRTVVGRLIVQDERVIPDERIRAFIGLVSSGVSTPSSFEEFDTGVYARQLPSGHGTYALTFVDPATGDPVFDDPLRLDSYFDGLSVLTTIPDVDELWEPDFNRSESFWFRYERLGTLGHLTGIGGTGAREFEVRASLSELWDLYHDQVSPGLQQFESIRQLLTRAELSYAEDATFGEVRYSAYVDELSIENLNRADVVDYRVDSMTLTTDRFVLRAQPTTISVVHLDEWIEGEVVLFVENLESVRVTQTFRIGEHAAQILVECGEQ